MPATRVPVVGAGEARDQTAIVGPGVAAVEGGCGGRSQVLIKVRDEVGQEEGEEFGQKEFGEPGRGREEQQEEEKSEGEQKEEHQREECQKRAKTEVCLAGQEVTTPIQGWEGGGWPRRRRRRIEG
eukprot:4714498-Lingulodinium_polyedra.AAC.1